MNSVIDTYNSIAAQYYKCREELILKEELDLFMSRIPAGGSVLDAGCGNGRDLTIFADNGYNCTGIDGSVGQLMFAQKRHYSRKVNFIHSDLRTVDFANKFDGIWCNAVLPHFSNDDIILILNKFKSSINQNGVIFASFKQGVGERQVIEYEFGNCTRYTNFHQKSDIIRFSDITGLNIMKMDYYNEKARFNDYNRDLNFIVTFFTYRPKVSHS